MGNNIVVAIDGYSSCGKSTLAKALAKKLNYIYVDSGAMYRAVTLYFLRNNVNLNVLSRH
jgi:cytidylate kinase